jgi:hypothetical protein
MMISFTWADTVAGGVPGRPCYTVSHGRCGRQGVPGRPCCATSRCGQLVPGRPCCAVSHGPTWSLGGFLASLVMQFHMGRRSRQGVPGRPAVQLHVVTMANLVMQFHMGRRGRQGVPGRPCCAASRCGHWVPGRPCYAISHGPTRSPGSFCQTLICSFTWADAVARGFLARSDMQFHMGRRSRWGVPGTPFYAVSNGPTRSTGGSCQACCATSRCDHARPCYAVSHGPTWSPGGTWRALLCSFTL